MGAVFVVLHAYERDLCEEVKLVGVFTTKERATEAVAQLRVQPGFRDYQDSFHIDQYELDLVHWQEGFVTHEVRPPKTV